MSPKLRVLALLGLAVIAAVVGGVIPALQYSAASLSVLLATCSMLEAVRIVSARLWVQADRLPDIVRSTTTTVATELHSMQVILRRFPECTMPTTGCSMRFANLHAVVDILDRNRPQRIVEFGSGISTLCIAAWLEETGEGKLLSFEHDPEWAERTNWYLRENRLQDVARVIAAPLVPEKDGGREKNAWYAVGDELASLGEIDFVVVDGPPAGTPDTRLARLPALDAVGKYLAAQAIIVLDDTIRSGEREVVECWMRALPELQLRFAGGVSGIAILERRAPTVSSDRSRIERGVGQMRFTDLRKRT